MSPQTMRNLYTWLKAVFKTAVDDELRRVSPCTSRISLPQIEKVEITPLTVEQVLTLADATPERYRMAVILQAALGLRISELLALHRHDVDTFTRTVRIERQLLRDGKVFGPPKTRHSRRTIPLAEDLVIPISEHIRQHPPNADGVIFTTSRGNPIRQDVYTDMIFKPAVAKAGLPRGTTPHDLRHHAASVLLRRGIPVNVVARYLGHASAELVLDTYGHCMPDSDDLTRAALDDIWRSRVMAVSSGAV
jgi:integrase